MPLLQARSEPFADRQSDLPQSLPPEDRNGQADIRDACSSFRSEGTVLSSGGGKHMQETWLLLEYCDKGSLQVGGIQSAGYSSFDGYSSKLLLANRDPGRRMCDLSKFCCRKGRFLLSEKVILSRVVASSRDLDLKRGQLRFSVCSCAGYASLCSGRQACALYCMPLCRHEECAVSHMLWTAS